MRSIIGYAIVIGAVLFGYVMSGGSLLLLVQPYEFIIIFGAALGAFIASCTKYTFRQALKHLPQIFKEKNPTKETYMQTLALLYSLFNKMHREGIISIEKDIETPQESPLFQAYPEIAEDAQTCYFIGDTMRTYLTTGNADELGNLMNTDINSIHAELHVAPKNLERMAESLPGMGIVAAVLGVVLAMAKINEPPEVLGHHVGAALLGTFLGILLCYGIFGPIAAKMENMMLERIAYFKCIREALVAALRGLSPMVALEYGRRAIQPEFRPAFTDMETTLKNLNATPKPDGN